MGLSYMQHHPHQHQQGQAPSHVPPHHPRPSSIVHQQHPSQASSQQVQHSSAYPSTHSNPPGYPQQQNQPSGAQQQTQQHHQDLPYYAHPSPYSTPGATSGYTSADTTDMMAATMPRPPYPPMSYHTPQSNSPASVASPSQHDQQRSMYGQPTSQLHQQSMYYGGQQYGSLSQQAAASSYAQHAQPTHQPMSSQASMMMPHSGAQHQITQHASQHAQAGMAGSPRHQKIEAHSMPSQMQRPNAPGPIGPPPAALNGAPLSTPTGSSSGVNANAAPGPIPATTPLVVRQDNNGVQWIAFEYSRDRVKMEYTIRCDVESVNTEELSPEFKQENCVYPRACCAKEQYRGNRLQYETECNTVGWALAQLNPSLRGKRGLIQRAVDSWRNSNQDPRLRSRRVRRMAKMNTRKSGPTPPHAPHLGSAAQSSLPTPGSLGPGGPASLSKPGMSSMGSQMHHQGGQGGDEVGDGDSSSYMDEQHHHHHQAPAAASGSEDDVRPTHVFNPYGGYPSNAPPHSSSAMSIHDALSGPSGGGHSIVARRAGSRGPAGSGGGGGSRGRGDTDPDDLFPDMPEAKKRKFILVEDSDRQSRLRVRVTLDGVDTREIPDSFRKGASVFPRSFFPREMQSPPPSATGSRFFEDDLETAAAEDDGTAETEGRRAGRGSVAARSDWIYVKVPVAEGSETDVAIPRMRKAVRGKEVRLNDLGYRMAWLQSRVFAGRTVFLQRALDCYRNKTRSAIESMMQDVKTVAPHYETRVGKRKWNECLRRGEKDETEH